MLYRNTQYVDSALEHTLLYHVFPKDHLMSIFVFAVTEEFQQNVASAHIVDTQMEL